MASIIDIESATDDFKISPRDAVRREDLRHFSSNPGMETAEPNVGLHNSAFGAISPICDYSDFDCTFSPNKDLGKLAMQTATSQTIQNAQIFPSVNLAGDRQHTKPRRFLEQSLLAAGILPDDKFDRSMSLAKSVMEKEITVFHDVEAARKQILIENPQADTIGHPELLLASCGMNQELGYDKREICGKLVYWSDVNNDAYTALEIIKIAPFELFEKFGPYDWENCVVTGGPTCRYAAEECLSLIRKILYNILAAGILPGEDLDKKLAMAKSIKNEETVLYKRVSAARSRLRDSCPAAHVYNHFDLLPLCCGMSREFEYEKREICGKLYYYSDANKRAYDILEAIGVQPFYLFEAFGSYEWSLQNRAKDLSDRGLSLLEGICPSETALDRKVQRYVVCHFLFLNAGPVNGFSSLKEAVKRMQ